MYIPEFEKLETQNKDELLKIIRRTNHKLSCLRKKMEHPDYKNNDVIFSPCDLVVYKSEKYFLELAINRYLALGGKYKESNSRRKGIEFNDRLNEISKITFTKGSFFTGYNTSIIDLSKEKPVFLEGHFDNFIEKETDFDKETFLHQLGELYIGEWRSCYTTKRFNIIVLDGEQWSLNFEYKDGTNKSFTGDNAYPYNFDELLELFLLTE